MNVSVETLLKILDKKNISWQHFDHPCDPDFEGDKEYPEINAISADWNAIPQYLINYFEKLENFEELWDDTTFSCSHCYGYINNQYDTFHMFNDCEPTGHKCINSCKDFQEDYIEEICDRPDMADNIVPKGILKKLGYSKILPEEYSFESGLYEGMNDSPHGITKDQRDKGNYNKLLFHVESSNPFMISFSLWEKLKEIQD